MYGRKKNLNGKEAALAAALHMSSSSSPEALEAAVLKHLIDHLRELEFSDHSFSTTMISEGLVDVPGEEDSEEREEFEQKLHLVVSSVIRRLQIAPKKTTTKKQKRLIEQ